MIVHLAGVNRPADESEFELVNTGLTAQLTSWLSVGSRSPLIIFSSSTQADQSNPYGTSKLAAERILETYSRENRAHVVVLRLTNVFGKSCRPNYNSVVATFCHAVANDLPVSVSDPDREVLFIYIDDVVAEVLRAIEGASTVSETAETTALLEQAPNFERRTVEPQYPRTLARLLSDIKSFREMRQSLILPDFSDRFLVSLYATYLSYLPKDEFSYALEKRVDARGALAEFMKSEGFGQIFVSRTHPGITRGNHYHETKTEKFLVLEGEGLIRFRHIESQEILEYGVRGDEFRVVDIPPGYTHSIENIGSTEMVTLFWASEIFDPERMDTVFEGVLS